MWKIRETRRTRRPRPDRKPLYDMLFALAMALGVKPKQLAKFLNQEKIQKYAEEISKEIKLKQEKDNKKLLDKLNKK